MTIDEESDDFQQIGLCLNEAREFDLESEVVYTALQAMKDNPELEIWDAMNIGLREWLK